MFKADNNRYTKTTIWCFYCQIKTYEVTLWPSVSLVIFEHVLFCWVKTCSIVVALIKLKHMK